MYNEFDKKGKIFTKVLQKIPVDVHIQTLTHLIKGKYHVHPDTRIKDDLDKSEMFLAVTDVSLYDLAGKLIKNCDFLSVNRQHIVWVFKDGDLKDAGEES
jgi:hypothetical protein